MALTLAQRDGLTVSEPFLARVRAAVRQHAVFRKGTGTQAQKDWSNDILRGDRAASAAEQMAGELAASTAILAATTPDASDITDEVVQEEVANICETYDGR